MTNPPLDLLKYRAFPEIGASLRRCSEKILHRFEEMVRELLPAAEELTLSQLRNSLPVILQQLAEALEADQPAATHELLDITRPHGEQRFHQHYNVNELLIEYHLLRRITIEEISHELKRPMDASESVALNLGIDTALRRGVVTFVEYQQQQVRQANELQTRYLSFLSHDLRGGLNGTLLMIEVMKRELAGQKSFEEDLQVMRRSILDSVGTMDHFLMAERLRDGKIKPTAAIVDVAEVVKGSVAEQEQAAVEKGVALMVDIGKGATANTDQMILRLILDNLLKNAVKFSKKGTIRVASHVSEDGGVALSVTDEGIGIAPDRLHDLFKRTVPATGASKSPGVGLSIVWHAVELLGGEVSVKSVLGKGSSFSVILPPLSEEPEKA